MRSGQASSACPIWATSLTGCGLELEPGWLWPLKRCQAAHGHNAPCWQGAEWPLDSNLLQSTPIDSNLLQAHWCIGGCIGSRPHEDGGLGKVDASLGFGEDSPVGRVARLEPIEVVDQLPLVGGKRG